MLDLPTTEELHALWPFLTGRERAEIRTLLERLQPPPTVDEWIQANFRLYDTKELIDLHDCQIRPLREALRTDAAGNYVYSTVIWSWPKKSAKTSIIAAVVDYVASTRPRAQIKLIANDQKQADSRVGHYLRENLRHDPVRKDQVAISTSGYTVRYPNGSVVEMLPIDPTGEAGGNDDMIVFSELWGWKSAAHQKMWSEMTLSPNKFGRSQRWIDTYAGHIGESPILERLYELGGENGKRLWDDLEVYANPAASLLCVWVTKHLLPWQTGATGQAYYREEAQLQTADEYARMHHNQWVHSQNVFVEPETWRSCQGDLRPLEPRAPIIIVLDAGISNDSFGLLTLTYRPDTDTVEPRMAYEWKPPAHGKIDLSQPEAEVRRLCKMYRVMQIVYDPYQLEDMAQRLRRDQVAPLYEFKQGAPREVADKALQDRIRDGRVVHANLPALTAHVLNANAQVVSEGRLRLVKRNQAAKIDLAVCLSMGAAMAPVALRGQGWARGAG